MMVSVFWLQGAACRVSSGANLHFVAQDRLSLNSNEIKMIAMAKLLPSKDPACPGVAPHTSALGTYNGPGNPGRRRRAPAR